MFVKQMGRNIVKENIRPLKSKGVRLRKILHKVIEAKISGVRRFL
jgi:hypothetical protein